MIRIHFAALLTILAGSACFNPEYTEGIRCSRNSQCPGDFLCDDADNRCRLIPVGAACDDDRQNGDETDIDCGGSCTPCAAGFACTGPDDCESQICEAAVCTNALCGDGIANGAETCDTAGESATCDSDCTTPECGDALLNTSAGETCDTGSNSDTCDSDCTPIACDDGIINAAAGEQCEPTDDSACPGYCINDCRCAYPRTCSEYLALVPGAASGVYTMDIDGDGPETSFDVYCDMTTDGGGWTLVQRTVWAWAESSLLRTDYATFHDSYLGSPQPGFAFRVPGKLWPALQQTNEHMMREVPRRASDGDDCGDLFYMATDGVWSVPVGGGATLTGVVDPIVLFNGASTLSAMDNGPSTTCVANNQGAPWPYGSCCSTCPTYLNGYWLDEPHPMTSRMTQPDYFGETMYTRCDPDLPRQSDNGSPHYGVNIMEYFLR